MARRGARSASRSGACGARRAIRQTVAPASVGGRPGGILFDLRRAWLRGRVGGTPPDWSSARREVKSVIPDVQTMLVALDRKTRLAPAIAKDRGWPSTTVSKLLIVREARTARRRLAQHDATFRLVLPIRGRSIEAWLRRPRGVLAGLLFLSPTSHPGGGRRTRPESVGVRSNSRSG